MHNKHFSTLPAEERRKKLSVILRQKSGNLLSESELDTLVGIIPFNRQILIRVRFCPQEKLSACYFTKSRKTGLQIRIPIDRIKRQAGVRYE